ncbi:MarR family winged helix-turn-helix transcriptional regulator [Gryllotalpicola protaetiae]|uniref:MarR family transcriptional regulator n=1 Tax=Gryllotalpicola protaetiae TaxID=2419771 RepID=A0A387BLT8_9MICO|nr:MarR family transcriptional regulator [Gryllotalpicola protaetiae]AYG03598.1 MarR family transcriptional regulator [Gryllotalpicola protaetiae]
MTNRGPEPWQPVAFLLAQVGGFAAQRFAERVGELGLQPSDVGILRIISRHEGALSQQILAGFLGVGPSRVVALIDGLEKKGLVARARSARDRRNYELTLTDAGRDVMARMRQVGSAHDRDLTGSLTADERATLGALLGKLAAVHGLAEGVHPGYRS